MDMIEINHDKCTLCEKCIAVCPFSALVRNNDQIQVLDLCRLCQLCVKKCPEQAIILQEDRPASSGVDNSSGVLVVAEWNLVGLHPVTYELLGKGRELADKVGQDLSCVVVGHGITNVCHELLEYGVNTCLAFD